MAIDCLALYLQSLRLRGGRCLLTTQVEEYPIHSDVFLAASSVSVEALRSALSFPSLSFLFFSFLFFFLFFSLTYPSTKQKSPAQRNVEDLMQAFKTFIFAAISCVLVWHAPPPLVTVLSPVQEGRAGAACYFQPIN